MPDSNRPQVQFRYDLQVANREIMHSIIALYGEKFNRLMRECSSSRLTASDYEGLPRLRSILRESPQLHQLPIAALQTLSSGRVKLLMDATPMFNSCSINVKAYVLLSLGIRPSHIEGMKNEQAATH